VQILQKNDKWLKIRNLSDNYGGFAEEKMIFLLSEKDFEKQENLLPVKVCLPFGKIYNSENQIINLPFGSTLWLDYKDQCLVANEIFIYNTFEIVKIAPQTTAEIVRIAKMFLNAPYLWGGKSIFGVDCSGLIQLIFNYIGINLPRDAAQQAMLGKSISHLMYANEGDLAFFENENGKIVHVGILLNNKEIIHSSGIVKIESIDQNGIISSKTNRYTHHLNCIKRIIDYSTFTNQQVLIL
jgi:hypothetical protein